MSKGKKMSRRQHALAVVSLLLVMILFVPTCFVLADLEPPCPPSCEDFSEVEEGPVYEWRFKIEDGFLYRRLYNVTDGVWAGEWILC